MRAVWTAAVALATLALGCVPAPLDLTNRHCPCTAGWTCDDARNLCVQGALPDAAGIDAASDAFTAADTGAGTDSGTDAASVVDAASFDAGIDAFVPPLDAGADAYVPADTGSDAGHDAGMPGDTGCSTTLAAALICDGFESDPGPWTGRDERMGLVVTDGVQAARGTRALHARTTAAGGQASRGVDPIGPFTSGELWIRMSLFVPASAVVNDFTWVSMGETVAPYGGISLGMGSDDATGSYSSISGDYVSDSTLVLPRDTWACLELHVVISDTAGAIEVYREGALRASRSGIDTRPGGGFSYFSAGVDYTDPVTQGPIEIWLDEVALSRTRVPCP